MTAKGQRYLGIELGGSRRTAVVALDHFAAEEKIFLAEMESPVQQLGDETPDEALLRVVEGYHASSAAMDAPLTLPPCLHCEIEDCPGVRKCPRDPVAWMRKEAERLKWGRGKLPTPYTQRPVDLLLRGQWQEEVAAPFPVDESFGSSRAPLAARMQYLKRHFSRLPLIEASPRLTLGTIASWFGLSAREVRRARDVEEGVEHRLGILDAMGGEVQREGLPQLFLYKTDIAALAQDLPAFDAFLCAYTALLGGLGMLEAETFEPAWGNVAKPRKLRREAE